MCGSFLSKPKVVEVIPIIPTQNDDEDVIEIATAVVENVIDRAKETVLIEMKSEKQDEAQAETAEKDRSCSKLTLDTNSVEDYEKSESKDKLNDRKSKSSQLMAEIEKCGDSKQSITEENTSEFCKTSTSWDHISLEADETFHASEGSGNWGELGENQ